MAYFMKDEFPDVDIDKVIKMCVFHDIGEIFTGDIPAFEKTDDHEDAETDALKKWVQSLPEPYTQELTELYAEMDAKETVEAKLYKALRVRRWKGRLPTYAPSQFSLETQSPEQILRNMCGAEAVHEIIMVLSLLPIGLSGFFGTPGVFLGTSLAAALFDSLFVIAQRYNRPRLMRVLMRQKLPGQV